VLTFEHSPNAYLSGRNLQNVRVARYAEVSAYDILWSDVVLVEQGAITGEAPVVEETAGDGRGRQGTAGGAAKKTARKTAKAPSAKKAAPKKAAKKAAAKPAAKKSARKTKETE
jgi:hypothetical protein